MKIKKIAERDNIDIGISSSNRNDIDFENDDDAYHYMICSEGSLYSSSNPDEWEFDGDKFKENDKISIILDMIRKELKIGRLKELYFRRLR